MVSSEQDYGSNIAKLIESRPGIRLLGMIVLTLLLLLWVYSPLFAPSTEFVADDYYYIVDNQAHLDSVSRVWLSPMNFDYFPVTVSLFALEKWFWGLNPAMFHLVNVFIFALAGTLAFDIGRKLSIERYAGAPHLRLYASIFCTLFFMLHPANVESVAAISNLKELLYVMFGLLSFRLFIAGGMSPGLRTVLVLVPLLLAQLSKGTAVVIPALFFLYVWLYEHGGANIREAVRGTWVFFLASGSLFLYQFNVALDSGVVGGGGALNAVQRIGGVVETLHMAIQKYVLPLHLSYEYDIRWPDSLAVWPHWILPSGLLLLTGVLVWKKRFRYLFLLALIVVPFAPYMNIVPLKHGIEGQIVYYDHYLLFSILASVPLALNLLGHVGEGMRKGLLGVMCLLTLVFLVDDHILSRFWETRESVYRRNIEVAPQLERSYLFLGRAYVDSGRYDEAISLFRRGLSVRKKVSDPAFYQALGDAYAFSGNYAEAESNYRTHLRHRPENLKTLQNLSSTLIMEGKDAEAKEIVHRWLSISPNDPAALENRSLLYRTE